MKLIISVAKTYKHRGNHVHKPSTKKYWHVYWLEHDEIEDEWKMYSKQISPLLVPYYKSKLVYKRIFYCSDCDSKFPTYVKKRQKEVECPYCFV